MPQIEIIADETETLANKIAKKICTRIDGMPEMAWADKRTVESICKIVHEELKFIAPYEKYIDQFIRDMELHARSLEAEVINFRQDLNTLKVHTHRID